MGGIIMARRMYLNDAAKELGVAPYFLRLRARAGEIPHLKAGNRYIFDIEQCEEFLMNEAMNNVKSDKETQYGVLRRVKAN
jgi:hypothetical protein